MKKISGFSLIELMIVLAIIGILIAIAAPSYQNYTRRAHYAEIVQAAAPYKIAVEECFQTVGDLSSCAAGTMAIPPGVEQGHGLVSRIEVNEGVIHIVPNALSGIQPEDDYVLTPEITQQALMWHASGRGVNLGYAR